MSITGLSDSKFYKKPFQRRNESPELDVFVAEYNEDASCRDSVPTSIKKSSRGRRMSLDMPMRNPIVPPQQAQAALLENQTLKEKKYKQPSSPGGKLASFLCSLFNQTGSKKMKPKSTKDVMNVKEEPLGGWRRRRSGISCFRRSNTCTNNNTDTKIKSKSLDSSSSSSGFNFKTRPPSEHTPVKSYSIHGHHKQVVSLEKPTSDHALIDDKRKMIALSLISEKVEISKDGPSEKAFSKCFSEKGKNQFGNSDHNYKVVEDGAESDTSSDLFELQNYDLGLDIYSSGFPVYHEKRTSN